MECFTPIQYLQIDIANAFGLDKFNWNARIGWVEDNEDHLAALTQQAKEPAQFMAAVGAYRKAQKGEPIGYLCGLDATASGLQLLSLLAGDELAARICNVIDSGQREDAYGRVSRRVDEILGGTTGVSQKAVKAALMTHLYGSKLEPIKAFGEDTPELKAFYQAIDELLPGANQLNHDLISLWQPDALAHSWTLPDGFDVVVKVMAPIEHTVQFLDQSFDIIEKVNKPKERGLSMGANIIHSIDGMIVREMNRRCNFNAARSTEIYNMIQFEQGGTYTLRKKDLALLRVLELFDETKFMSAVVLEYLDEHNHGHLDGIQRQAVVRLQESMPAKPFELLAIHDCFKFHCNYGNDVREQYINLLAELAESDILANIASQVRGLPTTLNKLSHNLPALIRQSEYALS